MSIGRLLSQLRAAYEHEGSETAKAGKLYSLTPGAAYQRYFHRRSRLLSRMTEDDRGTCRAIERTWRSNGRS